MITLFVCLNCDRETARIHAPDADGRGWFKNLKKALAGQDGVQVKSVNCLGGCECSVAEGDGNGCCSVGLVGSGKFGYVLNQLVPGMDDWKVLDFIKRYQRRKDGLLGCKDVPELKRHIATRLPATSEH